MESLSASYDSLRRELGRFMGWSRDPDDWSTSQATDGADILKAGLRSFYWPAVEGGGPRHVWSFLRQYATLDLATDTLSYSLPDDFGGLISGLNFASGTGELRLVQLPEEDMRALYAGSYLSGRPRYFAIRPRPGVMSVAGENQYEAMVYPVPAQADTLGYRYAINPPTLSADNLYPMGGPQHAETILEAVLTAAEKTLNDTLDVHAKRFQAYMASSLQLDREQFGL